MSFFKSIGKAIGGAAKAVTKVTGNVLKTVAPVAAIVPGVGGLVAGAASVLGNVLSPTKQEAIENAVHEQEVIKVEKIEQTILKENPSIDSQTLQAATQQMVNQTLSTTPTAKVDDSQSLTNISTTTKILQWIKSNAILVLGGLGVALFFLTNNKSRRRYRRF